MNKQGFALWILVLLCILEIPLTSPQGFRDPVVSVDNIFESSSDDTQLSIPDLIVAEEQNPLQDSLPNGEQEEGISQS